MMKFEQLRAQLRQAAQEQQQQREPQQREPQQESPKREAKRPAKERREQPPKPKRGKTAITEHRVFMPVLTGWGAALGGLSVAMLPGSLIASILMTTGLTALGGFARPVLALLAAALCGLAAFLIARALRRSVSAEPREHILAKVVSRRVNPIDPASELGSESLDAPLEGDLDASLAAAAAAAEEDGEDASLNWSAHWAEEEPMDLAADSVLEDEPTEDEAALASQELTLAPDQALEEPAPEPRDKIWVIGSEAEVAPQAEPEVPIEEAASAQPAPTPASGIERLRQSRPEDLSLVELVERFAAALHDHQNAARRRAGAISAGSGGEHAAAPVRDAALAEALKALSQFTQGDAAGDLAVGQVQGQSINRVGETERALRNALARLQDMRGAA